MTRAPKPSPPITPITMVSNQEAGKRDWLELIDRILSITSSIAIPVIIGIGGWVITNRLHDQDIVQRNQQFISDHTLQQTKYNNEQEDRQAQRVLEIIKLISSDNASQQRYG